MTTHNIVAEKKVRSPTQFAIAFTESSIKHLLRNVYCALEFIDSLVADFILSTKKFTRNVKTFFTTSCSVYKYNIKYSMNVDLWYNHDNGGKQKFFEKKNILLIYHSLQMVVYLCTLTRTDIHIVYKCI